MDKQRRAAHTARQRAKANWKKLCSDAVSCLHQNDLIHCKSPVSDMGINPQNEECSNHMYSSVGMLTYKLSFRNASSADNEQVEHSGATVKEQLSILIVKGRINVFRTPT
jgi:hypothetical protein